MVNRQKVDYNAIQERHPQLFVNLDEVPQDVSPTLKSNVKTSFHVCDVHPLTVDNRKSRKASVNRQSKE
ncbi:MAG: hypothetical protein F6J89_33520 [Symploca sp. SIO1C4]|uniref:Uncharacterized protein n=1 Tax=Symploca sp. SIO1C4 TaxID=2607765 RepID=A0A6B3NN85_9CYAN|nr:hypothetical protein [Symploca sp. SIO1C4]